MFGFLKKTAKKAEDTMDQAKNDLSETTEKMQQVLDESSDSVKTMVKVLTIALGVSILTNCITIFATLSKYKSRKMPVITIQNLYLGDKLK